MNIILGTFCLLPTIGRMSSPINIVLIRSLRNLAKRRSFRTPNPKPYNNNIINNTKILIPLNPIPLYSPWQPAAAAATPFYFRSDRRNLHFLREDDDDKFNKDVKKGVVGSRSWVNWPNAISATRLVSGPLLGWMIMQDMHLPAFIGLAVSGATDWLDGYVARRMGINSVVGSYLDPLADKVLIGSVAVAMVERGLLNSGLVALVVMRDLALVGGAVYVRASHLGFKSRTWSDLLNLDGIRPQKVEPLMISKVNTCLQLALVAGALLQPEFGTQGTASYITYLSWLVAATTMGSTVAYGRQHLKNKSIFIQKSA